MCPDCPRHYLATQRGCTALAVAAQSDRVLISSAAACAAQNLLAPLSVFTDNNAVLRVRRRPALPTSFLVNECRQPPPPLRPATTSNPPLNAPFLASFQAATDALHIFFAAGTPAAGAGPLRAAAEELVSEGALQLLKETCTEERPIGLQARLLL